MIFVREKSVKSQGISFQTKSGHPDLGRKATNKQTNKGNVSGCRYVSDCRSRGPMFDPGLVPYFCED